ncbi:MAG: WecB/TagA/CpsF family glycosyltransferase [Siculibacillus sp.]|nr:WecB/TagA/CpsF family glycosyltransferase [Siculibacillus sp.]
MTTFALGSVVEKKPTAIGTGGAVAVVDSWRINAPTEAWVIERIIQDVSEGRGGTVFTINLDHLAKLREDGAFRAAYERAAYVTADGMPVVALARSCGCDIERVTGADLVVPLCRAAAAAGIAVHFFGTCTEVLARAVERLRTEIPGLVVAGIEAPPMGFDPNGEAAREAAERIARSGAGICFIALGAPKQEIFADAALTWSDGVVYLGVGAALDFLAGERRRAPLMMQRIGMEWAWRTVQEPRRLVPRYVRSALWLAGYLMRSLLGIARDGGRPVDIAVEPRPSSTDRVVPTSLTTPGR